MTKNIYPIYSYSIETRIASSASPSGFCGVPVRKGIRNFCRQASCGRCVKFASQARARAFVDECAQVRRRDYEGRWAIVSALSNDFCRWRGLIHDRITYRRAVDLPRWRDFGLLVRWDGRAFAGIAYVPALGTRDLIDLLANGDDALGVQPLAGEPKAVASEVLASAPARDVSVSLKGIFFTARPTVVGSANERPPQNPWDEPMPFLF